MAGGQHSRANALQERLNIARTQIADLKEAASALEESSDKLQSEMSRFDTENWRDVVGDARAAAVDVDAARESLITSVENADDIEDDRGDSQ